MFYFLKWWHVHKLSTRSACLKPGKWERGKYTRDILIKFNMKEYENSPKNQPIYWHNMYKYRCKHLNGEWTVLDCFYYCFTSSNPKFWRKKNVSFISDSKMLLKHRYSPVMWWTVLNFLTCTTKSLWNNGTYSYSLTHELFTECLFK